MGILRTVLWSAACVTAGIALATVNIGGRTPWDRARGLTDQAPKLNSVKGEVEGAVATAKLKLAPKGDQPAEVHTESERDAVNALVARRAKK